jgi:6,7-dimethyl-8-ribityllumazine synthase
MQNADQSSMVPMGVVAQADGSALRVGVVQARFNMAITNKLTQACLAQLAQLGLAAESIQHITVPGALEVPVALQALALREEFDALIAIGCVIRGETHHFELVAGESAAGITRVSLDHDMPIVNAILTVENEAQAWVRVEEKGRDAANVALEMANLLNEILLTDEFS